MVCSSADQFAGNLLESSGADVKRSRLEGRNGLLMWKWTLEYLPMASRRDQGQQRQQQQKQQQHWNLRHNLPVMYPKCRDKEYTQKHSGSEPSSQKSAELLVARRDSWPGEDTRTLVNAKHIKMPGTRAVEQHRRRRRNVELLQIQIHGRWTQVEVRWSLSRRGQKRPL